MNRIYYFTGTGNSLAIAKMIAEKIGDCEVIRVTNKLDICEPIEADVLGFVFPIYSWGMPVMFKDFIKKIQINKADYVFVITNYAGNFGNALKSFQKEMIKKNRYLDAFCEVVMPNNYVVMGNAAPKEEAAKIVQKAKPIIDDYAQNIFNRKPVPMKKVKFAGKFLSAIVYSLFASNVKKSDKSFFSSDNCNGCGICVKVCPAENIILNENKQPIWQHRCEQCHACIHWCPQRAIEFSKKTQQKNRYTNPEIKVSELF